MTARMTGGAEAEDAGAGYVHKTITYIKKNLPLLIHKLLK